MAAKQDKGFDIPALIRLDLLDMRKIASKNMFLTVGEYFALLYKFKSDGPRASEALGELSCGSNDKACWHTVQDMKDLLEDLGCKKWPLILSDVISAVKKNNLELSADCAKSILEPFTELYNKIIGTENTGVQPDYITTGDATNVIETTPFSAQTLIKYLDKLEREENDRKLRILVVDDSPSVIKSVSSILSNEYKVYGITDPMKIEKFLHQITPELFLLDYKMPDRTGFELLPIIRGFKEHETTPCIIITSMGSVDHISASLSLGACDFIVKPFQEDILHKKVARHIKKKKLL